MGSEVLPQQENIAGRLVAKARVSRSIARSIWDAGWAAALATERTRAKLEPDEGFACDPCEWCFEQWAFNNGYPPPDDVHLQA